MEEQDPESAQKKPTKDRIKEAIQDVVDGLDVKAAVKRYKLPSLKVHLVTAALDDVRGNSISVLQAAKKYRIAKSTLYDKFHGVSTIDATKGPDPILTKVEEKLLVEWVIKCGQLGFPISREQVILSVTRLIKELNRKNPFIDDVPGRKWYDSFMRRHPELSIRTPQNLTKSRANVTEIQVRNWFMEVEKYLKDNNYFSILSDRTRVFNADEAAFFYNPKGQKVLYKRGSKNVYCTINVNEKECVTVLMTANSAGHILPPMVVLKYQRVPDKIAKAIPDEWAVGTSESGWMTAETFYEYVANIFNKWLEENTIQKPVILFVDGHSSHLTLHLSNFCSENGIVLIALLANATHLMQPLDVSCFRTLKKHWLSEATNFRLSTMQPVISKTDFFPLLQRAIQSSLSYAVVNNGFRKSGLTPWNPDAVDYSKIPSPMVTDNENLDQPEIAAVASVKEWELTLTKLNNYLGEDKLEFFLSTKNASNWPEIVDEEDHSLFNFWRYVFDHAEDERIAARPQIPQPHVQNSQVEAGSAPKENSVETPMPADCEALEIETEILTLDNLIDYDGLLPPLQASGSLEFSSETNEFLLDVYSSVSPPVSVDLTVSHAPASSIILDLPGKSSTTAISELHATPQNLSTNSSKVTSPTSVTVTQETPSTSAASELRTLTVSPNVVTPSTPSTSKTASYATPSEENITSVTTKVPLSSTLSGSSQTATPSTSTGKLIAQVTPSTSSSPIVPEPPSITPATPLCSPANKALAAQESTFQKTPSKTKKSLKSLVPSPFKRALFWPDETKRSAKKFRKKEKIPSVVTSKQWQQYHEKKVKEKQEIESEKKRKREEREERQKQKKSKTVKKKLNHTPKTKQSELEPLEENNSEAEDDPTQGLAATVKENDHVIVEYEGEYFPGIVLKKSEETVSVKTMAMAGIEVWKWPHKPDICDYEYTSLIMIIKEPEKYGNRGHFKVPEMKSLR